MVFERHCWLKQRIFRGYKTTAACNLMELDSGRIPLQKISYMKNALDNDPD